VSDSEWGPGSKADSPGFELGHLDDGTPYELIFGEHPHSRSDNNIYARFAHRMGAEAERVVGFAGHRILVRIELRTMNYLKTSWMSGDEVRKGGEYRIWLGGYEVYSGAFRDPFETLLTIRRKLHELMDLPVKLWNGESPEGRKVFWRDEPAVITMWLPDQGCVVMEADGPEPFTPPPWREDGEAERTVKDDILSPHIWWWRKDDDAEA
jgi:hypothetical protein